MVDLTNRTDRSDLFTTEVICVYSSIQVTLIVIVHRKDDLLPNTNTDVRLVERIL